jgi:hypothetical protein
VLGVPNRDADAGALPAEAPNRDAAAGALPAEEPNGLFDASVDVVWL